MWEDNLRVKKKNFVRVKKENYSQFKPLKWAIKNAWIAAFVSSAGDRQTIQRRQLESVVFDLRQADRLY